MEQLLHALVAMQQTHRQNLQFLSNFWTDQAKEPTPAVESMIDDLMQRLILLTPIIYLLLVNDQILWLKSLQLL